MSGDRRVLVVDDDADLREAISSFLGSRGFDVVEAGNGLEALLQVKRTRPAVVVLDLMMPRLGGLDALKRIRGFDPSIVVIVTTGTPDAELHERALSLGAAAVMPKPFTLAELLPALGGADALPSVPAELPPSSPAPAAPGPPATSAGRILVVDDDPDIRTMLEDFLLEHGFETRSAPDGAAGLRAIIEHAPDVVLLDIDMPGLSGVQALPAIRAVAPHLTVIMVSGTSDVEVSKQALASGAFDYVTKPIDLAYLRQSLDTALMMKRLET